MLAEILVNYSTLLRRCCGFGGGGFLVSMTRLADTTVTPGSAVSAGVESECSLLHLRDCEKEYCTLRSRLCPL